MTYNPNIPNPGDNISVSQGQIKINFGQLNSIFATDHYAFNDATVSSRGFHKKIVFPAIPTAPTVVPNSISSALYPAADPRDTLSANETQLFFANGKGIQQITNAFKSATANGWTMLPSGIILMWGTKTGPHTGGTVVPVTFNNIPNYVGAPATGFPTACFQVFMIGENSDTTTKSQNLTQGTLTNLGFSANIAGSLANLRWFAIGI